MWKTPGKPALSASAVVSFGTSGMQNLEGANTGRQERQKTQDERSEDILETSNKTSQDHSVQRGGAQVLSAVLTFAKPVEQSSSPEGSAAS